VTDFRKMGARARKELGINERNIVALESILIRAFLLEDVSVSERVSRRIAEECDRQGVVARLTMNRWAGGAHDD